MIWLRSMGQVPESEQNLENWIALIYMWCIIFCLFFWDNVKYYLYNRKLRKRRQHLSALVKQWRDSHEV